MNNEPEGIRPGSRHRRPQAARTPNVWLIAGIAALATMAVAAGVIMYMHEAAPPAAVAGPSKIGAHPTATAAPPPPAAVPDPGTISTPAPPSAALAAGFAQLAKTLDAEVGIAFSAVGNGQEPTPLGDWQSGGPAWSTIKVPLVIAALQKEHTVTPPMNAAITESDNAAAESIWAGLGDPVTAGHQVEAVLRRTGDPTIVQSQRVRPPFTAFGQTDWPLTEQVRFTSAAFCDNANKPVFDLMGRIEPGQSWGIGTIPGTQFKGGWGPSPTGNYLVRQIGVLTAPNGKVAVALAAQPASGKFDDGIADLNAMADWLKTNLGALPAGQCGG
jgi:hypothetical protein